MNEDAGVFKLSWIEAQVKGIEKVMVGKRRMVAKGIKHAKAKCPMCEAEDALTIRLAPQRRDKSGFHARWYCGCGFRGME